MTQHTAGEGAICDCMDKVDAALAEQNMCLVRSFNLYDGKATGLVVATEKVNAKKRGRGTRLVASFCPFCGTSFTRRAAASLSTGDAK